MKRWTVIVCWVALVTGLALLGICGVQNLTGLLWSTNVDLPAKKIKPEKRKSGNYGYVFKTSSQLKLPVRLAHLAVVTEDGKPLPYRGSSRNDVSMRGLGHYIVKGRAVAFSTPDHSDPRVNGRTYQADIPQMVRGRTFVRLSIVVLLAASVLVALRRGRDSFLQAKRIASSLASHSERVTDRFFTPYLAAWLAIPSVLYCFGMPPLWKDFDALYQLTDPPSAFTILHFSWLYSFLGHIPGWIVDVFLAMVGRGSWPDWQMWVVPDKFQLRHAYALILVQHGLTWLALAGFIRRLTSSANLQFILAILAMSWSPFYSVSHVLGSEYPAMLCMILLASLGVAVLREASLRNLIVYGLVLMAAIASRHINAILAMALPLALFVKPWLEGQKEVRVGQKFTRGFTMALIGCVVGVGALAVNGFAKKGLAGIYGIEPRSTIGRVTGTREWLYESSEDEQAHWLPILKAKTDDPWSKRALEVLADEGNYWAGSHSTIHQEIAASENLSGDALETRCDLAFNGAAKAMLKTMSPPMRANIINDTKFLFFEFDSGVFMVFPTSRHQKVEAHLNRLAATDLSDTAWGGKPWEDYDHRLPQPRSVKAHMLLFQGVKVWHFYFVFAVFAAAAIWRNRHILDTTVWATVLAFCSIVMMLATNILICFFDRYALPIYILVPLAAAMVIADALAKTEKSKVV